VVNFGGEYRPTPALTILFQLNNLFDTAFDGERPTQNVTFFAPGVPRILWLGLRYAFGP
jgi:outer membrane receptor protein involved in Fe transport